MEVNNKNEDYKQKAKSLVIKKVYFTMYSVADTLARLEQLAREGFLLNKIEGRTFYFEEIEPCEVKYAIEYFEKAAIIKGELKKETIDFVSECEIKGWQYAGMSGKNCFFYSFKEDVSAINDEPKSKIKAVKKGAYMTELIAYIVLESICELYLTSALLSTPRSNND
jgi:hypothetical protein